MIRIKCQCGYEADMRDFCFTTINGELPPGTFQCPGCNFSWRRVESEHRVIRAGAEVMIIPGKINIVAQQPRL